MFLLISLSPSMFFCVSAYRLVLQEPSLFFSPLLSSFLLSSALSVFTPGIGSSEVVGTQEEQVANTCLLSQIMSPLFDKPPFVGIKDCVLGHPSEKNKTPHGGVLSPLPFTVDTLCHGGSWHFFWCSSWYWGLQDFSGSLRHHFAS